jgi:hypothetical protein
MGVLCRRLEVPKDFLKFPLNLNNSRACLVLRLKNRAFYRKCVLVIFKLFECLKALLMFLLDKGFFFFFKQPFEY